MLYEDPTDAGTTCDWGSAKRCTNTTNQQPPSAPKAAEEDGALPRDAPDRRAPTPQWFSWVPLDPQYPGYWYPDPTLYVPPQDPAEQPRKDTPLPPEHCQEETKARDVESNPQRYSIPCKRFKETRFADQYEIDMRDDPGCRAGACLKASGVLLIVFLVTGLALIATGVYGYAASESKVDCGHMSRAICSLHGCECAWMVERGRCVSAEFAHVVSDLKPSPPYHNVISETEDDPESKGMHVGGACARSVRMVLGGALALASLLGLMVVAVLAFVVNKMGEA